MASKKKPTLSKIFFSLLVGIPTLFSLATKTFQFVGLEARIASKNITNILILTIISAILLASSWLCVLGMTLFYFISLQWTVQFSLLMLFLLHIVLVAIFLFAILRCKKNLTLRQIRKRFHHPETAYDDF